MYFEDFIIGQRFYTKPYTVTLEEIEEFAAKYDPLSIHLDESFAKESIYGGIIAPGLFTLCAVWGQWGRLNILDKEVIGGLCIDYLNWTYPVRPGDSLKAQLEITELIPSSKGGKGVIAIKVEAANQDEKTVLTAQVKGLIKKREG